MFFNNNEALIFQRLTFGATYNRTFAVLKERWMFFLAMGFMVFVPYMFVMITYMHFLRDFILDAQTLGQDAAAMAAQDPNSYGAENNNFNYDENNNNNNNNGNSYFMQDDVLFPAAGGAESDFDPTMYFADTLAYLQGEIGRVVFEIILYMFLGVIGGNAIARAVGELYAGRDPSFADCLRKGFARFCQIFAVCWIVGGVLFLGYLVTISIAIALFSVDGGFAKFLGVVILAVFFVVVIYIQVAMMLATPVVMVENKGPVKAIQRCWELASNNRCYIYCTVFCFTIVAVFVFGILYGVIFAANPMGRFTTWGAILQTLQIVVLFPVAAILSNVVYLNIRIEREGLNRQVLLGDLDGGSPSKEYGMVSATVIGSTSEYKDDYPQKV